MVVLMSMAVLMNMVLMMMIMAMIKKVIKFTLRDGYKAVVEVEEKHGGFTVYPER